MAESEPLDPKYLDVIERATRGSLVEPPIVDATLLCIGCNNVATRDDGRCAACTTDRRLTKDIKEDAKDRLARRGLAYADLHLKGAEIAAAKGDTKPAEWALENIGVVTPAARQGGGPSVIVQIGMNLPGLPGAD